MNKSKIKINLSFFLIIIIFILCFFYFIKDVKNLFYSIFAPFQLKLWSLAQNSRSFFQILFFCLSLKEENLKLKNENQKLIFENLNLKESLEKEKVFEEFLKNEPSPKFQFVVAKIIGKMPFQDEIIINKGAKDGILQNSPVITESKVVVGKVSYVYKNFSRVQLITSKNFIFNVEIEDKKIFAKAVGEDNLQLKIIQLPLTEEIQENLIVKTTALGDIFPEGLLVGKIKEIKKSPLESFQEAKIQPMFSLNELRYVFVIPKW